MRVPPADPSPVHSVLSRPKKHRRILVIQRRAEIFEVLHDV